MKYNKSISFQTGPASPRTTVIGFVVAATIILAIAVLFAVQTHKLDNAGLRTDGVVIRFEETKDDMHRAIFRFSDATGVFHDVPDNTQSTHRRYELGEAVPIVYDPGDPSKARKDSAFTLYVLPAALGFMSLLFYGGAVLVWRFRSFFQKDYEARRGKTIVTVVNNDGSVTHTYRSSVPVFRGVAVFLAALGIAALFGALFFLIREPVAGDAPYSISFLIFPLVLGAALLTGAIVSYRHANFLQELEEQACREQTNRTGHR